MMFDLLLQIGVASLAQLIKTQSQYRCTSLSDIDGPTEINVLPITVAS